MDCIGHPFLEAYCLVQYPSKLGLYWSSVFGRTFLNVVNTHPKLDCAGLPFLEGEYVTGPMKTGHICTNYTPLENGTFLGLCL